LLHKESILTNLFVSTILIVLFCVLFRKNPIIAGIDFVYIIWWHRTIPRI